MIETKIPIRMNNGLTKTSPEMATEIAATYQEV
jgi:hypothetical protein